MAKNVKSGKIEHVKREIAKAVFEKFAYDEGNKPLLDALAKQ